MHFPNNNKLEEEKSIKLFKKYDQGITIRNLIFTVIITVTLCMLLFNVINISRVDGKSMMNTLEDGESVLINTLVYDNNKPKRQDVVVFERKELEARYFVKRVIAVEGDTIEIRGSVVFLNGKSLKETYIKEPMIYKDSPLMKIPEGKVFVMGDNRNNSMDSRYDRIGLVDIRDEVFGKVMYHLPSFKRVE